MIRATPALGLALLSACSHPQAASTPDRLRSEPAGQATLAAAPDATSAARAKLSLLDYEKSDVVSIERDERPSMPKFVREHITMVIDDPLDEIGTFEQKFIYFRRTGSEPRPTVLVFTLFGQEILVDRLAARYFARKGLNALIVVPSDVIGDRKRPLSDMNPMLVRQIIVGRMGIDMLEEFPETDPDRIFVYGLSMGGIRSAILFGADPRIKRAGVVTGGGDIPGIITDSDYGTLRKLRDKRMAEEGIPDLASLRAYLEEVFTIDPMDFACLRDPEDLIMVMSTNDSHVKDEFQDKLYDAFSRPEEDKFPGRIRSKIGHLSTGALFYKWADRFSDFFHAYEAEPAPEG